MRSAATLITGLSLLSATQIQYTYLFIEISIFTIYLALFFWLVQRLPFFAKRPLLWRAIFLFKVGMGLLYGLIYQTIFNGGDTFVYFHAAQQIAYSFPEYPGYYLQAWTGQSPIPPSVAVFTYPDTTMFLKGLGTYTLIHLQVLLIWISGGFYSVHVLFMAFLGTWGLSFWYRILSKQYNGKLAFLGLLLLPSTAFWTSGLHKEGFLLFAVGAALYYGPRWQKSMRYKVYTVGAWLFLALVRYHFLVLLFPLWLIYLWSIRNPRSLKRRFLRGYMALLLIALITLAFFPKLLELVVQRQNEFQAEFGRSDLDVPALEPSLIEVLWFLPKGLFNACIQPLIWKSKGLLPFLAALETLLFWLTLVALWSHHSKRSYRPLELFLIFAGLSQLLLIGLLVSNSGTIVRYRSLAFGMLLVAAIMRLRKAPLMQAVTLKAVPFQEVNSTAQKITSDS